MISVAFDLKTTSPEWTQEEREGYMGRNFYPVIPKVRWQVEARPEANCMVYRADYTQPHENVALGAELPPYGVAVVVVE